MTNDWFPSQMYIAEKLHRLLLDLRMKQLSDETARRMGCPTNSQSKNFIRRARETHSDHKYHYSKSVYEASAKKLIIICNEHGEFLQAPANLLRGLACNMGAFVAMSNAIGQTATAAETFVARAKLKHGSKNDYENVEQVVISSL